MCVNILIDNSGFQDIAFCDALRCVLLTRPVWASRCIGTLCVFRAMQIGCNNAMWPDKYGHYREAKYAQTKHHWFWKVWRGLGLIHTGRARKFERKPFDVDCPQCEHSHSGTQVPFALRRLARPVWMRPHRSTSVPASRG